MIPIFLVLDRSAPKGPGGFSVLRHDVDDSDLLKGLEDLCNLRRHV